MPESKAQKIVFRTSATEARFLRDLPIHKSQEEVETDKNGNVTFSIFVCPDSSLIMEFCKLGSLVEVLSPKEVREDVATKLMNAAKLYIKQE